MQETILLPTLNSRWQNAWYCHDWLVRMCDTARRVMEVLYEAFNNLYDVLTQMFDALTPCLRGFADAVSSLVDLIPNDFCESGRKSYPQSYQHHVHNFSNKKVNTRGFVQTKRPTCRRYC